MTKQELLNFISNELGNGIIVFIENLDNGKKNERMMMTSKEDLIDIVTNYFNDNLHGHVRDNVMTTIVGYRIEVTI